jgi:hypothetical protein
MNTGRLKFDPDVEHALEGLRMLAAVRVRRLAEKLGVPIIEWPAQPGAHVYAPPS